MREEVKKSLDTVFEHAGLKESGPVTRKNRGRNWQPLMAFIGIAIIVALLIMLPITSDVPDLDTATVPEETSDLFELKGLYIGSGVNVAQIVAQTLPEGVYKGIELKTSQEPYGVIVPLNQSLNESGQLYVAMYVFTLIQNADFIQFDMPEDSIKIEKKQLAELYEVDFTAFTTEFQLKKKINQMTGVIRTIPELQLIGQDESFIEQAIQTAKIVDETVRVRRINYFLTFKEKEYLFFVKDQEVHFVINDSPLDDIYFEPEAVYQMTDDMAERFIQYMDSDFTAISGEVTFVGGNMITVEQSEQMGNLGEEELLHVLVDEAKAFKVGDFVQVWTNEVTKQYPPQAMATKIKYFGSMNEMGIREILQQNRVPLVEVESHTNTVFGVALNKVKPTVYELDGKFVYLFEFENEAHRIKGVEEFMENTKFMDLTSFETYEKGAYLLFYVHDYDLSSKNIPYVEEIQAVFDTLK